MMQIVRNNKPITLKVGTRTYVLCHTTDNTIIFSLITKINLYLEGYARGPPEVS